MLSLAIAVAMPGLGGCQSRATAQVATEIPPPPKGAPGGPGGSGGSGPSNPNPVPQEKEDALDQALADARKLVNKLSGLVRERRTALVSEWQDRNLRMNEKIEDLRKAGQNVPGASREPWAVRMNDVERRQRAVEGCLKALSSSALYSHSAAGWGKLRREFRDAWDSLSAAVEQAESELAQPRSGRDRTDAG